MKMITLPLGALETNCYVVYDEASKACALVDPGAMPQTILDTLEKNELALQKIFLTHAHFDHILAVHDVLEATGAQFVCPEADTWLLSRDNMGQFRSLAR